jgi:hypothetical protein
VDLALYKNIRLGKGVKVQLRIEGFNILNRNNFLRHPSAADNTTARTTWSSAPILSDDIVTPRRRNASRHLEGGATL